MNRICQHCGKHVAAEIIDGLCPECLMKMGLGLGTQASRDVPDSRRAFVPPSPDELAPRFPQLEILTFVGQGGMGAVYKARQKELERIVALKILPPGIGNEEAFAERFVREAKSMARLNHPGIVTIHDFGKVQGSPSGPAASAPATGETLAITNSSPRPLYYFIMEFVDGVSLRQLMGAGRISPREALAIVPQICDALQYAHDQGIVHRDIKPENILLDRQGRVKVADFGLAKLMGNEPPTGERAAGSAESPDGSVSGAALTDAGKIMGTPNYMAPEQVNNPAHVDHRADIYALGVVFYQMLTGELPGKRIEPPSNKVQVDVRLDEVVLRALQRKPERRYQQASELKTDVDTIAQDTTSDEFAGSPRPMPHHKRRVLVGACLAFMAVSLIGCLSYRAARSRRGVDLLARYPTALTAGDTSERNARCWEFTDADLYRVSGFSLVISNTFHLELGPADLGIGHCADGALWALLIPRADGTLASAATGSTQPVAQVWLRFHPSDIRRLFPPAKVSLDGTTNRAAHLIFIANLKLNPKVGSSFISFPQGYNGPVKLTVPDPREVIVDMDISDGSRRMFALNLETQTARMNMPSWYQYAPKDTGTNPAPANPAEAFIAQQTREVQDGSDWAKYRLWEAYAKGLHGVARDPAKARQWLEGFVQGLYVVTFESANGFNPSTPTEYLNRIQAFSPVTSGAERVGIAGFFRTKNQQGKLIGSFLSNEPDRLKDHFAANPYLKVTSVKPMTPESFLAYDSTPQESLPADHKTGVAASGLSPQLRTNGPALLKLLDSLKADFSPGVSALVVDDNLPAALNVLTNLQPRADQALELLKGTEFEEAGRTIDARYHELLQELAANHATNAKKLLASLSDLGRETEANLRRLLSRADTNPPATAGAARAPRHFWFNYESEPSPGKRYWTAVNQTWVEQYESGESSQFKVTGRDTVDGAPGTVVTKVSGDPDKTNTENDGTFQAFIPDLGSPNMFFCYRFKVDSEWQPWQQLAQIEGAE